MNRKKSLGNILKSIPFVFSFITIAILIFLINILLSSTDFLKEESVSNIVRKSYYAFFIPTSDQAFFNGLKKGAMAAEEDFDCYVSFYSIDNNIMDLNMVPFLGINGIALYPLGKSSEIKDQIKFLEEYGIPVIQIENEVLRDKNTFYVGTNNFESGRAIGEISKRTEKDLLNIQIIYSEKNPGLLSNKSIVELGLKSSLGDKINKLDYTITSLNPLDAERIVYEIVKNSPEVDLIVLTDPNDSLVAVQAIIDSNMVGEIQIISFGDSDEILNYMDKGVILGSIVRNPYEIGYNAVKSLYEIENTGFTSSYLDTGIKTLW
ncbi:MAG: substrate-binding domain-containing protein [Spirochaetales bacterium]|nr:substrate-binding domain-containing protein [Spirochaetales bacterium]